MSALSDLLLAHLPRGTTRRQIALAIDADPRHDVKLSTVYPYFNGKHGQPELKTLRALADHLPGVTYSQLLAAAGLPASSGPYVAPDESDLLTLRQRRAIDELIRAMVTDDSTSSGGAVIPMSPPPGRPSATERRGLKVAAKREKDPDDGGPG